MPSLRHLTLVRIDIPPELPPFPHLTCLKIIPASLAVTSSQLFHLLQHSPKLKEIEVYGVITGGFVEASILPVRLPELSHIYILSTDLEVSAIFANLKYPPSVRVTFRNERPHNGEPDLSSLVEMCRNLRQGIGTLAIDKLELHGGWHNGSFRLTVRSRDNVHLLSLMLEVERCYSPASGLTLCAALPLETIPYLTLQGFENMTRTEWSRLFSRGAQVHDLHLVDIGAPLIKALMNYSSKEPPLPKLHTLHLHECTFITWRRDGDESLFIAFKDFLEERKHLGIPVKKTTITTSPITAEKVEELREFTDISWDGDEVFVVDDESQNSDDDE